MRHCRRCGRDLPAADFGVRKGGKGRSECRACEAARTRDYAAVKRAQVNEANREHMRQRRCHPIKGPALKKREKAWREQNRDRLRDQDRTRRQHKKRADFFAYHVQFVRRYNASVTADDLRLLWEAQDGLCGLTGQPLIAQAGEAQVDHIVPKSRGGSHDLENLRWVSRVATNAKRDLTDDEFLELCTNVAQWIGENLIRAIRAAA